MAKLVWDEVSKRLFETGCDRGVLYVRDNTGAYPTGVPWNGLVSITESPEGAEPNPQYADNIKYVNIMSAEEFKGTIEAFTYPDEFAGCDGSAEPVPGVTIGQQARSTFGLAYRTLLGNDTEGTDYGYKIHLVWGALASPSEKGYTTVNDSPEPVTFSWEFSTTPVPVTGYRPTATMVIDSTTVTAVKMGLLEDALYGSSGAGVAHLPTPDAVLAIIGGV